MKRFLLRTFICGITAIGICFLYLIVIGLFYGHKFDPFYGRLTSTHPQGLIIGSSRSAQALEPKYIADNLYNFSFTLAHSSFDQSYLNFIKKYHVINGNSPSKKLIHILSVDPWTIRTSHQKKDSIINSGSFTEELALPPMKPNLEYLVRFGGPALLFDFLNYGHINETGRLEMPKKATETPAEFRKKLDEKLDSYRQKSEYTDGYVSEKRLQVMRDLIAYLQQDGKVYLVRLPVHPEMLALENQICPEFNELMRSLSTEMNSPYFMLSDFSYETNDGNHIANSESQRISEQIRDSIKVYSHIIQ
jgi:hypothetical protein